MDFWKQSWQQATKHAHEAAEKAKKLALDASNNAQSYAKQAGQSATKAFVDTRKQLTNLSLEDVVDSLQFGAQKLTETPPTKEEFEAYAITPQLEDYLRSLTYSTFRDFPKSRLRRRKSDEEDFLLSPWQIRHVTLILDRVKEIQDLRFVLCPQRMDETVFWQIYFLLCAKYLPPGTVEGIEQESLGMGTHILEEDDDDVEQEEKDDKKEVLKKQEGTQQSSQEQQSNNSEDHTPDVGPSTVQAEDPDLDQYLKDVLEEADDFKEDDLVDLENDEELEDYLNQLNDEDDIGEAGDGEEDDFTKVEKQEVTKNE
eukprot:TRINITY_DN16016_c0_g1_i1.p2 TRINITY_DN16016_c0_g1~~TRINITY_DN16016_c0_g1_i1.p2  ORF type:complete len:313 (+),score=75.46 TRINITY_DN16016_c0_g1_i1:49-987(+)